MKYCKVTGAGVIGNKVVTTEVECVQQRRLPYLQIIGGSPREATERRERVIAALDSTGIRLPSRRITVSMGVCDGWPPGAGDVAVALAIMGSVGLIPSDRLRDLAIFGSLSLDGRVLPLPNRAPVRAWLEGTTAAVLLPWEDSHLLPPERSGSGVRNLAEIGSYLRGQSRFGPRLPPQTGRDESLDEGAWQFLAGRPLGERIAQIAAAGGHPLLLSGAWAAEGRSVVEAIRSLLPPLFAGEQEEIQSIYGILGEAVPEGRPLRELRSEQVPRAVKWDAGTGLWGELSLAHGGILFLREFGERPLQLWQRLQEPVESGVLRSFRKGRSVSQGADWRLVACASKCLCGGEGDCRCLPAEKDKHRRRLEQVRGNFPLGYGPEEKRGTADSFVAASTRVAAVWARNGKRQAGCNHRLPLEAAFRVKPWTQEAKVAWMASRGGAWAGFGGGLAKVALTVSDLREGEAVSREDVLEARHYVPEPFVPVARSGSKGWSASAPEVSSRAIP